MASLTINTDGTMTAKLDPREQQMAVLIREESGPAALSEVFALILSNAGKTLLGTRYDRMSTQEQGAIITRMAAAKPPTATKPVEEIPTATGPANVPGPMPGEITTDPAPVPEGVNAIAP